MLVDFYFKNFCSFKEEQEFSMQKSKDNTIDDNYFFANAPGKKIGLLNSAVVYGANASGKSNFLLALYYMKHIVQFSAQNKTYLPYRGFKLDSDSTKKPTEFVVTFITNNVRYQYGFSFIKERIVEEWLYAYPRGHAQLWFYRQYDDETSKYTWKFSKLFTGNKEVWRASTRDNALFLSTASLLNSEMLKPVIDWFDNTLQFMDDLVISSQISDSSAEMCMGEGKNEIIKFLKAADIDIEDIQVKKEEIQDKIVQDMANIVKQLLSGVVKGSELDDSYKYTYAFQFIHLNSEGKPVSFSESEESQGTRRLLTLAAPIISALSEGLVLCVDELNMSLHPELVRFIVKCFNNHTLNKNNAQFIFTTHETSLLNQKDLRRDQVWFVQKKPSSKDSILYSLLDFSPRKGTENIEQGYLSGRYRALPLIDYYSFIEDL